MTENVILVIKYGFIALVLCLILYLYMMLDVTRSERDDALDKVQRLSDMVSNQNEAIDEMREAAQNQITKLLLAQKDIEKQRDNYNLRVKELMKEKVPNDCKLAMKWGNDKAAKLYQCWVVDCQNTLHQ